MRFLGNIEAKTDIKGRVFLPSVFRKELQAAGEERLVLRTDIYGKCLKLYPESAWNRRMDEMFAKVMEWDEEEQQVLRQYVSEAEVITLDGNGRFLLSKRFMQSAGITQAVRFLGMNDIIEIWSAESAEKPFVPQEQFAQKLKAIMSKSL